MENFIKYILIYLRLTAPFSTSQFYFQFTSLTLQLFFLYFFSSGNMQLL